MILICENCGKHVQVHEVPEVKSCTDCTETETISTVSDLEDGNQVLFGDRKMPLKVGDITESVYKEDGVITVIKEAMLSGPRGGQVVLQECQSGRLRVSVGGFNGPRYTVNNLRRVV